MKWQFTRLAMSDTTQKTHLFTNVIKPDSKGSIKTQKNKVGKNPVLLGKLGRFVGLE